jgi:mevalonate pyrophosphate decarboxylase
LEGFKKMERPVCIICGKHGNEIRHDDFIRMQYEAQHEKEMQELQKALKQAQYEMAKEAREQTIKEVFERLEKESLIMTSGTYLTRPTICISKEQFEKLKKELLEEKWLNVR